ncbi:MAG: hypothetical protein JEZ05_08355 [Tenericutes bacterium]|nr:hypothetical protein [Mycoplasmatota bacterium]
MKRRVLGIILFLLIIPLFMGCDQTTEATRAQTATTVEATTVVALGTVTFEIYTTGDNPDTAEVETEYVSNSMDVSFYELDTLFDLLDTNFTITYEESDFGRYLTAIDTLIVLEGNEYISFYINDGYAATGVDATDLVDGSVYQFKLETF